MIKELNSNPGPGIYANNKVPVGKGGPKYGFGSSTRVNLKYDNSPGPGSYKIPVQVGNVPGYSMPNRNHTYKFA
jgi:hypothetical protein